MKIHRLYADDKGESHFEDVEVQYTEATRGGRLSPRPDGEARPAQASVTAWLQCFA